MYDEGIENGLNELSLDEKNKRYRLYSCRDCLFGGRWF